MMSTLLEKKRVCMKLDDTIPLSCYIEGQDKKDSYVVSSCYVYISTRIVFSIVREMRMTICIIVSLY